MGLVQYKFNSNGNDSIGTNHLTEVSVTYTTGKINQAAVLNGSSGYFKIASPSDDFIFNKGDFSLTFWVKTSSNSLSAIYTNRPDGSTSNSCLQFRMKTTGIIELVHTGATANSVAAVNTGSWVFVAITKAGTTLKYYINATGETGITIPDDNYGNSSYDLQIGCSDNSAEFFNAQLDDFRIYKGTCLTQDFINMIYNSGSGTEETSISGTITIASGTSGTKAINTNYPVTEGLTAGTNKLPAKPYLEYQNTIVSQKEMVGL